MNDAIAMALCFGGDPIGWLHAFRNRNKKDMKHASAPWGKMASVARKFRRDLAQSYAERALQ